MPSPVPPHQALPVHVNAKRARMDGESAAERLSDPPAVWDGRVVELLREILNRHGGSFDPSRTSHNKMGRASEDERAYEQQQQRFCWEEGCW